VYLIRSIWVAVLALVLFSGNGAFAGDYSLVYAIDANGKTDSGRIETCTYAKACEIEPAGMRLSIFLSFLHQDHSSTQLYIYGARGCCYSADADRTIYLDIRPGLLRVPIYAGVRRKGNEFVRNERFGVLYLEFSNMR
jgi:hypothetical protein